MQKCTSEFNNSFVFIPLLSQFRRKLFPNQTGQQTYNRMLRLYSAAIWKDISQHVKDSASNVSHLPAVNNRV